MHRLVRSRVYTWAMRIYYYIHPNDRPYAVTRYVAYMHVRQAPDRYWNGINCMLNNNHNDKILNTNEGKNKEKKELGEKNASKTLSKRKYNRQTKAINSVFKI